MLTPTKKSKILDFDVQKTKEENDQNAPTSNKSQKVTL